MTAALGPGTVVDVVLKGVRVCRQDPATGEVLIEDGTGRHYPMPPQAAVEREGAAKPLGFGDYANSFERIGEVIDQYRCGELSAEAAMAAVHEQVGDRPERLGGAS